MFSFSLGLRLSLRLWLRLSFSLEFYLIMIADGGGEVGAVDEGGLNKKVAPEQDITAHVHAYPIPLYDHTWSLQPCTWSL